MEQFALPTAGDVKKVAKDFVIDDINLSFLSFFSIISFIFFFLQILSSLKAQQ